MFFITTTIVQNKEGELSNPSTLFGLFFLQNVNNNNVNNCYYKPTSG